MNHKLLVIFIYLILIFGSCSDDIREFRKTIISGEIENFESYPDDQLVELFIYDPFSSPEPIHKTYYPDDNGTFIFEFERLYPQEVLIRYKQLFYIYMYPGDSVHVVIDANVLNDSLNSPGDFYNYIQLTGDSERFNHDFISFRQAYRDSLINFSAERSAVKNLDHVNYRNYIKNRKNRYYSFIEKFNEEYETCKEFQEWVAIWIEINATKIQ
jgi:hypothetical protein